MPNRNINNTNKNKLKEQLIATILPPGREEIQL